jgi:hypothetical protein
MARQPNSTGGSDGRVIRHDSKEAGQRARGAERDARSQPGDKSPVRGQRSGAPVRDLRKDGTR